MSDRVPPHNLVAEQSLLGAMLLTDTAIEASHELLTVDDFYRPAHGHIYAAIIALWSAGDPVDPVVVAESLSRAGLLQDIGGPATLLSLQAHTPATSSARKYASIIAELSTLRRIIAVAGEMAEAAYSVPDQPGAVLDLFNSKLAALDAGSPADLPDDLSTLSAFLGRPEEEHAPWTIPGLLRRNWRVMLVAGEGAGKALALDTPVPVPGGWMTMGDLSVGDLVFGSDGKPVPVIAATPVLVDRPCYRVTFSDGEQIVADANHQWETISYARRQHGRWEPRVVTTEVLAGSVIARAGHTLNHLVERSNPLDLPDADLPLDPYLLGVWLGDGTSRSGQITTADIPVVDRIRASGWECSPTADPRGITWIIHRQADDDAKVAEARRLIGAGVSQRAAERQVGLPRSAVEADTARGGVRSKRSTRAGLGGVLSQMGLLRNKHVPTAYLRASIPQRAALLAGLLDADGSAQRNSVELTLTDPVLAAGAVELIRSLGFRPSAAWSPATLYGRVVGSRCRIRFTPDRPVFGLARKQGILAGSCHRRSISRYIAAVEPVPSGPVRCIQVANPDGIFLVGRSMVRTHNSVLLRQVAVSAAAGLHPFTRRPIPPVRSLVMDLENPDEAIDEVCAPMAELAEATDGWDPDRCWLWRRPSGINLRQRRDRHELEAVLREAHPDLVCLGPIYKAYVARGKDDEESATRETIAALDDLRTRYGFALLMEHHAPHGEGNKNGRTMRPHGSVYWQRWPEIGIGLEAVRDMPGSLKLGRFRGDRVRNQWPERIDRATPWPWSGVWAAGTFSPDSPEEPDPMF